MRKGFWIATASSLAFLIVSSALIVFVFSSYSPGFMATPEMKLGSVSATTNSFNVTVDSITSSGVQFSDIEVELLINGTELSSSPTNTRNANPFEFYNGDSYVTITYRDTDGNGMLSAGDAIYWTTTGTLGRGGEYRLVLIYVPSSDQMGSVDFNIK